MQENSGESTVQPIDIRQVFRDKNPRLARFIPGIAYWLIEKLVHLDFVNYILKKHGNKRGLDFAEASIQEFNITVEVRGEERLPSGGRYVFASNHPLGGFDGMILVTLLQKKYHNLKVLVNDILRNISLMDDIFVPINKHGQQSSEAVREIDRIFNSDNQILTFPAGLVSRRKRGVIRDPEWKKNFITKSVSSRRDVIPVHVSGRCSNVFYFAANLRKFLGIKSNLEMMLLPHETYRHRNEHIVITIGYPVKWQTFNKSRKAGEWAKKIQEYVYTLADGKAAPFNPDEV
ncbi:MAG TPA: 1-acyl-sn-glycerol-3-phosphate acyltransferase [Bacteroidales bacterium]|nr:1-acyl-sn-glycerol-3-phosphate acyltransferase [Bacteroidales bacterium]